MTEVSIVRTPGCVFICDFLFMIRYRHPVVVEIALLLSLMVCFRRRFLSRDWKQNRDSRAPKVWKTTQSVCGVQHSPIPLRRKLLVHFSCWDDSGAMFQVSHCTVNDMILRKWTYKWRKCIWLETTPAIHCKMLHDCQQYNYSHCYFCSLLVMH